ncbi:MAG: hypothetical protein KGL39_53710 [Patescibacteria group bacterium]|nr:hypothetical protein [Patescibacteria group bacterium]
MSDLSQENLDWAVQAASDGRTLEYIASVLGVKQRRAATVIRVHSGKMQAAKRRVDLQAKTAWRSSAADTSAARAKAEALFEHPVFDDVAIENDDAPRRGRPKGSGNSAQAEAEALAKAARLERRRRFLLSCRFSRHWDAIWFHTRRHMRGRTLRSIYGADCLIWARGGGIDWAIPE